MATDAQKGGKWNCLNQSVPCVGTGLGNPVACGDGIGSAVCVGRGVLVGVGVIVGAGVGSIH